MTIKRERMHLPDIIGRGYKTFWNFRGRYRVCKGSRASKKSKTTALWYVYHIMKLHGSNLLVIRKTGRTLKDSCFTELKWAVSRLHVEHLWKFKESPLEATYTPTGQKIYFRGLDDPLKVTSITVDTGVLCWMWIEEAYEITKESDFDTLDESIRGECPDGLFKQITLTFNPWNERHWLKQRFFDTPDPDVLALTTNYTCNEWLDKADLAVFERMKLHNPRRYAVAGLGGWGVVDGLVYENWKEQDFTVSDLPEDARCVCGLDFGYTNDPTAGYIGFLSQSHRKIWVWDEIYKKGMSNDAIWREVQRMGYAKERWIADSAEPKSIDQLKGLGMRIQGAKKGRDSINNGIQWLQDFEIIIHPRCTDFLTEISSYSWKTDKFNKRLNEPEDDNNHLMDAMRYAHEPFMTKSKWIY